MTQCIEFQPEAKTQGFALKYFRILKTFEALFLLQICVDEHQVPTPIQIRFYQSIYAMLIMPDFRLCKWQDPRKNKLAMFISVLVLRPSESSARPVFL